MKKIYEKYMYNYGFLCVVTSIILNFLIESFSRRSISQTINYLLDSPLVFIYNTLIILVTFLVVFLVKRRVFFYSIISVIWLAGGITNGIVLSNRVTPFTAVELKLLNSVADVMTKYLSKFQIILIIVTVVLVIIALILALIFAPKYKGEINYKRNIIVVVVAICSFGGVSKIAVKTGVISDYFGNIANAYLEYGFPYCFSNTLLNTGIDKPSNYSEETIANIFSKSETNYDENDDDIAELVNNGEGVQASEEKTPNIIFVQLESFFDITKMTDLEFSEDPIPVFRELMEQYTSGYLTMPSVGAGTANTEFEVITGMSLDFFGPGEYPYKTILKETTSESINYDLKDLGYSTHAIHNNKGTFYTRQNVFKQLGFDTFTSIEYMNVEETTPLGWAKDKYLTENILDALESTENQDFIYTISVQGHGDYPTYEVEGHSAITVSGIEDEERLNSIEYYVNEIKEMDDFVGELIETLSNIDEDTILVLYGDHLPSLDITDEELVNGDIYQTEYVVWSNFNLENEDEDLEAYQLTSKVLDMLDIDNGTLIKYHQDYKDSEDYLQNLELLQYDMLYGEQYIYGGENPFEATAMTMGVKDVVISNVYEEDGNLYIKGDNFTTYSRAQINGSAEDTIYIDSQTLMLEDYTINDGDIFVIQQVTVTNHVLGKTVKYQYTDGQIQVLEQNNN